MSGDFYKPDDEGGFEEKKPGKRKDHEGPDATDGSGLDRDLAAQPCNDLGNARRFVRRFGEEFIFVERVGWFHWDGARWNVEEGKSAAFRSAQQASELIKQERAAFEASPGGMAKDAVNAWSHKLKQWQETSGQAHAVRSMLTSSEPYLLKQIDALDADPLLCPCLNGTLVLSRESIFRPSSRADLCTRRLGVAFDARATCPRFLRFLAQIIPDDESRDFLQRVFGYCLSGSTREQVLFMFHGTGNNGKSTLMNVIRHVFGDYASISPIATFLAKREGYSGGADASPDLARLVGARLVSASEPPEGARLDEGRVKEITGGEPLTTRHLNQSFFTFRPVFKVIILVNNLPAIWGVDHGIWRRIRLVPYTVEIPNDRIERDLDERLIEEGPGILRWIVEGFEAYAQIGLDPPELAVAAVAAYRADQDIVGEFLAECCTVERVDPSSTVDPPTESAKRLRQVYKVWSEEQGVDALASRTFGQKLAGRGLRRYKTGGLNFYRGVKLKPSWSVKIA